MENQKTQKIVRSFKDAANMAMLTYGAVIAVKGLSGLAKDFWDWKIQSSKNSEK